MTRGRPTWDQVVAELELARAERDEAKAQLKALRTEHTNACGFWVQRNAEQNVTIANLKAKLAAAQPESGAA
ncbi:MULTISPECIES: hypothetical protein [Mycolicibacterium]|jgi:hypothetical protein|uniref:Uncharacterized protein n=3 Tax=Mycolicibacterium TaxID=1866885 RepID=A0AAE4VH18_MYCFO|nr:MULTISPECIES: hypothetical protein [Mycolicibacterium]KLI04535.1 hypothetical protein AA982_29565 [Mycolicibacterium senegalense]KLO53821.1 hypothetical protein ABW05_22365 [Mycolicibacterium senegalense]KMV16367.1 hypothetical protein ACT17_20600 [Mycolicibacterium conceptionense]MDV7194322.1 hypothetical protein [Mycolicibacterium fortuitum]MDV7294259.1 hypothetical protein [Mycolicibacterium fortuitum]